MIESGSQLASSEWSYFLNEDEIGNKPLKLTIEPNEEESAALCRRFDLIEIKKMKISYNIVRQNGSLIIHIKGHISADITQKCVVSLEPVPEQIEEDFEAWFSDPSKAVSFAKARRDRMSNKEKEETPLLEEQDDPEAIIDGKIDLGELAAQYVSLSLNPYPHAPGVKHALGDDEEAHKPEGENYKNPFAALKDWKEKGGRKEN